MSSKSRVVKPRKPSIHHVDTSWQLKEKYISIEEIEISDSDSDAAPRSRKKAANDFRRFHRRGLYLFLLLFLGSWYTYTQYQQRPASMTEAEALMQSVMEGSNDAHTSHALPEFADMVLVQNLDPALVPTSGKHRDRGGRLVIVGDVHGMKDELIKLLDKVNFDRKADHLILAGDMIAKGPDSHGVLDLIMDLGATAVRGNHEDRVLLAYAGLHSPQVQLDVDGKEDNSDARDKKLADDKAFTHSNEYKDRLLAKQLSRKQIEWLKKCPVILRVGNIEGMGQVLVVHAGLVPGLNLDSQDPYFAMNMRTIDLKTHIPSDSRDGTPWSKVRPPINSTHASLAEFS